MNYTEINLDLQAFAKRVYDSYLYQSTFYNFLNPNYIGTIRQTGAPVIEIAKQNPVTAHVRSTKEIQTAFDSFRKTELNKPFYNFKDDNSMEFNFYFQLQRQLF